MRWRDGATRVTYSHRSWFSSLITAMLPHNWWQMVVNDRLQLSRTFFIDLRNSQIDDFHLARGGKKGLKLLIGFPFVTSVHCYCQVTRVESTPTNGMVSGVWFATSFCMDSPIISNFFEMFGKVSHTCFFFLLQHFFLSPDTTMD